MHEAGSANMPKAVMIREGVRLQRNDVQLLLPTVSCQALSEGVAAGHKWFSDFRLRYLHRMTLMAPAITGLEAMSAGSFT